MRERDTDPIPIRPLGATGVDVSALGLGGYEGNVHEAFAKGASKVMYDNAQIEGMCGR